MKTSLHSLIVALIFAVLQSSALQLNAETRTFTSTAGTSIQGELVSVNGDMVTIKQADGQALTIRAADFSAADVAYLQAHGLKQRDAFSRAADEPPVVSHELDHLVPVNPHPGDWHVRYSDQIQSRFKLASFFFAQMVVRPSFSAEYVVRLHGTKDDNQFDETNKFFLTYSAADKNIWYSMPENNEEKKQQKVAISVTTIELPKPLATRIYQLWKRMLLRTRYPEEDSGGLDGTKFEFGTWSFYGETWSPAERKSPLLFIELGESLIAYCKGAPAQRQVTAKEIESKATQLKEYLDKHPSK